jgi:hypothetical protein
MEKNLVIYVESGLDLFLQTEVHDFPQDRGFWSPESDWK